MITNLMEEYINQKKNFLKEFTKLILQEKYNNDISERYIETYIDSRIYNYGDQTQKFFYKRIYTTLENLEHELQKELGNENENEHDKDNEELKEIIEKNLELYKYILYIDGVRNIDDLNEFSKNIYLKQSEEFNVEPLKGFEDRTYKMITQFIEEKERFLTKLETTDFYLSVSKYILVDDTYKAELKYKFKIPYIYSDAVINEVYNEGTINEDKLIIMYMLLVERCIKDIEQGKFETKYIADFANTLFDKESKMKRSLRVMHNLAIQEKLILKIKYKDLVENKELIYSLIRDGFKFAIILDETFEIDINNFKKLEMFSYLLIPKGSKKQDVVKELEPRLDNEIIYEV